MCKLLLVLWAISEVRSLWKTEFGRTVIYALCLCLTAAILGLAAADAHFFYSF